MAHSSLKFIPGVDVIATPTLNQLGISSAQLVRWFAEPRQSYYDIQQGAFIQKLGGWTKYFSSPMTAIVRALWAWEDLNAQAWLAFGTETSGGSAQLGLITNSVLTDVTPRSTIDDITAAVSSTSGSSIFTITDATTTNITTYDTVYIATQIAIGGVVLFGLYACDPDGHIAATTYTVQATDILGNPLAATSTSSSPVLPQVTTTSGQSSVTVTLPNHGYAVGDDFPVLRSTTVGGSTFFGHYVVMSVVDANNFTITATQTPTSSTSGYLNGNLAHYIYGFGVGSIPAGSGYGAGGYGSGGYGTGTAITPATGTAISATDWTLDNWGEDLIACPIRTATAPAYQPVYVWSPANSASPAVVIPEAPPVNDGIFVAMPQRQIVAWGSTVDGTQDPLLVRWCDVSDFSTWAPTVTNQAGSYRIPKGSRIVGALQTPQQALLWTDIDVWAMQYTGPPYVYGFNEIGTGCGLIGRKAAGSLNGSVYWMGPSQFYALGAEGVQQVSCPVWDVVFQNLNSAQTSKIRCAVNSRFGEIVWYFASAGSNEVNTYVKYTPALNAWDYGTLARTAWVDQSVVGAPIGADPTTLYLYQHETSNDADGQALNASFQTGYAAISDGDQIMYVDQVWPDFKFGTYGAAPSATVNMTFYVADYPGQTPRTYGPYTITDTTEYISPRFRGRLVSVGLTSTDVGSFWRLGNVRYRVKPDGSF
ncbi:MAG: hypothetical protein KGL39_50865 [Patescibacteria group bacterium]|nr:hypothetical protein [Patescibacteria group bacterium]